MDLKWIMAVKTIIILSALSFSLSFQPVHADLDDNLNATNVTISNAESMISQLDALILNYSFLEDDFEITIKQNEAKSKLSTAYAYYQSAIDNRDTNPVLAATFNNLAKADADGADTIARSTMLLANAKILSHIATEEETKTKINSFSTNLDKISKRLDGGNRTLETYNDLVKNLSKKGLDVTFSKEKLEEARILLKRANDLHNSSIEYFNKDLDKAISFSEDAIKTLDEFDFEAQSAYHYAMIIQKTRTGKKVDMERLLNESQAEINNASRKRNTALNAIKTLNDLGAVTTGFEVDIQENSQYLKSASSLLEKAILRYNIGDYESSKQFILDALDSLGTFNSRHVEFMDSILGVLDQEMLEKQNSTKGSIEKAEAEVGKYVNLFSKNHTDFAFSKISGSNVLLNKGRASIQDAKINWVNKRFEDSVSNYTDAYLALESGNQEIDSLNTFINVTNTISLLEKNREVIENLTGERFSGLDGPDDESISEFTRIFNLSLFEYDRQNYSLAQEFASDALEKSDSLIAKANRNITSRKHIIALSVYSLFLIFIIIFIEKFSRRIK